MCSACQNRSSARTAPILRAVSPADIPPPSGVGQARRGDGTHPLPISRGAPRAPGAPDRPVFCRASRPPAQPFPIPGGTGVPPLGLRIRLTARQIHAPTRYAEFFRRRGPRFLHYVGSPESSRASKSPGQLESGVKMRKPTRDAAEARAQTTSGSPGMRGPPAARGGAGGAMTRVSRRGSHDGPP